MLRLVERELAQIVDVKAQKLVCAGLDVVVGVHVFIGVELPRPPRSTDQRKTRGGLGELDGEANSLRDVIHPSSGKVICHAVVLVISRADIDAGDVVTSAIANIFDKVGGCWV